MPVKTAGGLERQLLEYPDNDVSVRILRDGRELTLNIHTRPARGYLLGLQGTDSTVTALQPDGPALRAGLQAGDDITAVNGRPVRSLEGLDEALRQAHGAANIEVQRGGKPVALSVQMPNAVVANEFIRSIDFQSGTTLSWVKEGGPAYAAGMRPGDVILSVGGQAVKTWPEVLSAMGKAGKGPREVEWSRDGQVHQATLTPTLMDVGGGGLIGVEMEWPVMEDRQYGAISAISHGLTDFKRTLTDIVASVQGLATRQVSPRMLGGIITIARITYRAAEFGLGKLFYLTAVLSAYIAFMNVLPIPVLDGGHLLFLAIEKLRGRRVSEKVMAVAQTVGGVLLLALVVYVTRNDILNWFWPR